MVLLACLTFLSSEKRRVLTGLAWVTLNSSATNDTGKGILEVLLFRLIELIDGPFSHELAAFFPFLPPVTWERHTGGRAVAVVL